MKQGFFVALLAIALGGIGTYAVAQPLLDGNPLAMLGKVKSDLELNTSQQLQWDAVVAQTKAAHEAGRANFEQLKAALQAELAKPEPDFAAVATIADGVRGQHAALHKQTRDASRRSEPLKAASFARSLSLSTVGSPAGGPARPLKRPGIFFGIQIRFLKQRLK